MKINYCDQYQLLRILSLKAELKKLPNVKIGKQRDKAVVREYYRGENGKLVYRSFDACSVEGKTRCQQAVRRKEILEQIKLIEAGSGNSLVKINETCKIKLKTAVLSEALWNAVGCDQNPRPKKASYFHNGVQMRSRTEVLIAEILDELGLEYKYEPAIQFGDAIIHPDFLVYIPCLKRCLIIEFYGLSDNEGYLIDTVGKMTAYSNGGLLLNRDVLGFYGTERSMNSNEYIYNNIVMVINLLATESVLLE